VPFTPAPRPPAHAPTPALLCRHLALSTNSIDKIGGLAGMDNLQILSLGRNLLKRIEGLEPVSGTLEELWVSYNQIVSLVGGWVGGCFWVGG
jgi:hypothetical protein